MGSTAELRYGWKRSGLEAPVISRSLTSLEQMFALLNDGFFGQNCPFVGCTLSVRSTASASFAVGFDAANLQYRAELAFQQTRWKYPMAGCRVIGAKKMAYTVEDVVEVQAWSKRTVHVVEQSGGWLPLREKLSREGQMPTADGDCCVVYVIYSPDQPASNLRSLDVLIHFHHSLTDGSGIRSILNEFVARLADPVLSMSAIWGTEIERLYPAQVELSTEEERGGVEVDFPPSEIEKDLRSFVTPDHGLPLYRPDILTPKRENRGSSLVAHTFGSPEFLTKLLQKSRSHGVTLSAVLMASLYQVTWEMAVTRPESTSSYSIFTAIDLRNKGRMIEPYGERNHYVFNSVAKESIEIKTILVQKASEASGFWDLVQSVSMQFAAATKKKGLAGTENNRTKLLIRELPRLAGKQEGGPSRPQTSPYFVSDPPGSNQLDGNYQMNDETGTFLELESYQISTDQNWAKISARSHSWKGKLTLCLVFNVIRIPRTEMERILSRWVEILEGLSG